MTPQPKFLVFSLFLLFSMLPTAWAEETTNADKETNEESGVTDYIAMEPAFVTHVGSPGGKLTYLKAAVTLRASNQTTRTAVVAHMPRLRHELVMLFGEQTDTATLTTLDGQKALREEAQSRINGVLEEQQTGEAITGVLFTEFVVQK
ncbi:MULTISPECIES: flagellar basal body-associated protein FliL [unclassified Marinobacter]|uniref:flagellar basal body-associated FliL family protein n=1 Tax=unclassified Marinobacter TaxID=83889 RepID=UPI0026E1CAD1|nr:MULTISPECIES: flagellar basal body-associated FliL family protein [unclassified Marinobacter]MDO6443479.1 flagellar basal body-associated FliL family protein [Marinobacter sp. 2_MG-2023]MDO6824136.1 flagellar basal body-associated FliL family protein [Marinobacter sp. 1_MG-2023]